MKVFTIAIAFFSITILLAQEHRPEIHCKHFFYGYPFGTPKTNDLIIREAYAMSNNDETKFADWVAYRLDTFSIKGGGRKRKWKADPWLEESETLEPNDYKGANAMLKTDRGHQAPLGSLDGYSSYFETNYLSNITPQKSNLNQGIWKKIEDLIRVKVVEHKEIYVITGPLYEKEMPKLPGCSESHKIPSGYWKIILFENAYGKIYASSFILDQNTPRKFDIKNAYKSINEIEKRSGLDFLWLLKNEKENALESRIMKLDEW